MSLKYQTVKISNLGVLLRSFWKRIRCFEITN